MTRSELRARVLHGLNDSPTSPAFFSTSEVDGMLDEGMEVLCEQGALVQRTALLPLQEGMVFYSTRALGPDVIAPTRIWSDDGSRRLELASLRDLDARHETWLTVTGDPQVWFPVSWDLFGVWPGSAAAGGRLRVDYAAWPQPLASDDDEPEAGEADGDALVLYGVYDGAMKRWDAELGIRAWRLFLKAAGAATDRAGAGRTQARRFQPPAAPGEGFTTGVRL